MNTSPFHVALVTGGRDYYPDQQIQEQFLSLCGQKGINLVLTGGASGVDETIERACYRAGVYCMPLRALWPRLGNSAGPRRNQVLMEMAQQLDDAPLGFVFKGGAGTADMIRRLCKAGIERLHMTQDDSRASR